MGFKGLDKKLRPYAIMLTVGKGHKPLTSSQIRSFFKTQRDMRKKGTASSIEEEPPIHN